MYPVGGNKAENCNGTTLATVLDLDRICYTPSNSKQHTCSKDIKSNDLSKQMEQTKSITRIKQSIRTRGRTQWQLIELTKLDGEYGESRWSNTQFKPTSTPTRLKQNGSAGVRSHHKTISTKQKYRYNCMRFWSSKTWINELKPNTAATPTTIEMNNTRK